MIYIREASRGWHLRIFSLSFRVEKNQLTSAFHGVTRKKGLHFAFERFETSFKNQKKEVMQKNINTD